MSENKEMRPVFRSVTGRHLMEYTFENEEVISYQLEMLANNHIPGLLKNEVLRVDGKVRLSFDITSLIPLGKLFERREIGRKEFLQIMRQLISVIGALDEFLLDCANLVFDSSAIYIDPQSLKMGFVYLPLNDVPKNLEPLKAFLLKSIIQDIRFYNEQTDNYVQKLIELLKTRDLDIDVFKGYLSSMEQVHEPSVKLPVQTVEVESSRTVKAKVPEIIKEMELPKANAAPKPQKPAEKTARFSYPVRSVIILGSVISTLVLFGIALVISGTLSPANPDFILSLFGYFMMGGASTYLVYSKLFTPDKRIERKEVSKDAPVDIPGNKMAYVNKAFAVPDISVTQAKKEAAPVKEVHDRTVLLDAGSLKQPSLTRVGGKSETITLSRFPFMLGRLEGQVDYCLKNPAVGKMHAEIKRTEEGYFISDMNSRNGTHLNGERLEPSRDYRLENGAHLAFANDEFIFHEGRC